MRKVRRQQLKLPNPIMAFLHAVSPPPLGMVSRSPPTLDCLETLPYALSDDEYTLSPTFLGMDDSKFGCLINQAKGQCTLHDPLHPFLSVGVSL